MQQRLHFIIFIVAAILVGCTGGDTKNEVQVGDFNQVMHQADSAKTDREDADHLTHSQMIILAGLYSDMNDLDNALRTDERNVRLTMEGTSWGNTPQLQLIDRRMALAKTAYLQLPHCIRHRSHSHRGSPQSDTYPL